jgi:hypothetical protein
MKFAEPVTHEFGAFVLVPDLDLYFATLHHYLNTVEDKYDHHIRIGGRLFKFWAKPGGLINPRTGKVAFEYYLSWKDSVGASKCSYAIKPLFGPGTQTKTGKTIPLPTKGTQIQIQSSYMEMDEHFDVLFSFMDVIDASRFKTQIDRKNSTIYQMARHIRYHEMYEYDVVGVLEAIEKETSMLGNSTLLKDLDAGKFKMYKMDSPDFSVCNITTKWNHSIKSYRIKNFLDRVPEDPLRHPKLEVFLKSEQDQNPTLNDYLELKKDLDTLLIKLLSFVNPIEYVSDNYFDGGRIFEYRYDLPKWDFKKEYPTMPYDFEGDTIIPKALKALAFVATQSEGCTEFSTIEAATEIPTSTLWRFINFWKAEGILETKRKEVTYVFFKTKKLWEQSKEPLINLCSLLNFGFKKVFGEVFIDSGVIRPFKERNTKLKNTRSFRKQKGVEDKKDVQHFVCETYHEAQSLAKELRAMGIAFTMGVKSSKDNIRYSRVIE